MEENRINISGYFGALYDRYTYEIEVDENLARHIPVPWRLRKNPSSCNYSDLSYSHCYELIDEFIEWISDNEIGIEFIDHLSNAVYCIGPDLTTAYTNYPVIIILMKFKTDKDEALYKLRWS